MKRVRIRISGVVQGVGFRFCCRREALALGVRGWVRNRLDGSVEAVAEGAVGAVDRFVDWCRTGPRGARVTGVEAVDEPDAGGFEEFEIVP